MQDTIARGQRQQVEALYAAFNRQDVEAILERLTDDVRWANGMEGGHVEGRARVREYWLKQFETLRPSVEPLAISGDGQGRVTVDVHQVVRSLDGEILVDQRVVHHFAFDGPLIARFDIA